MLLTIMLFKETLYRLHFSHSKLSALILPLHVSNEPLRLLGTLTIDLHSKYIDFLSLLILVRKNNSFKCLAQMFKNYPF